MSEENVAVVRRFYESVGRGDSASLAEIIHPDCEFRIPDVLPYGGSYRGPGGFQEYLVRATAVQSSEPGALCAEYYNFYDAGDDVFDVGLLRSRTRAGVDFASPMVHHATVREGKIVSFHSYMDTGRILEALEGRWLPPSRFAMPEPKLMFTNEPRA